MHHVGVSHLAVPVAANAPCLACMSFDVFATSSRKSSGTAWLASPTRSSRIPCPPGVVRRRDGRFCAALQAFEHCAASGRCYQSCMPVCTRCHARLLVATQWRFTSTRNTTHAAKTRRPLCQQQQRRRRPLHAPQRGLRLQRYTRLHRLHMHLRSHDPPDTWIRCPQFLLPVQKLPRGRGSDPDGQRRFHRCMRPSSPQAAARCGHRPGNGQRGSLLMYQEPQQQRLLQGHLACCTWWTPKPILSPHEETRWRRCRRCTITSPTGLADARGR